MNTNNLSESIKLYAISLQADISINLKSGKKYSQEYQFSKFIDFQSRKEIIVRTLDELERRQMEMLKNLPNIDHNMIDSDIMDFQDKASRTNIEIEQLIDELFSKKNKKINVETAVNYFNVINKKEKDIDKFIDGVASYRMEYDINKKFNNLYNAIEKAIDNVLKSEFNLEYNTNDNSIMNGEMIKESKEDVKNESINEGDQLKKDSKQTFRISIEAKDKEVINENQEYVKILEPEETNEPQEIQDLNKNGDIETNQVTNLKNINDVNS